ncbi:branched-chain amino acid ABC transporter permease [Xanthobacteraceae bacterium A53D]
MASSKTAAHDASNPLAGSPLAGMATVIAVELVGALFLRQFLLVDDWRMVIGMLLIFGAALVAMERVPSIEARIEAAFARHSRLAMLLGIVIVLAFPFVLEGNTYALHLCVISMLYAVLALALNFQLGSANIPNFATGASYGIGAYASALLALNFGISFWLALPAAAIVATIFGFLLGIPSMRTRDSYLALVTIAFGVVIHQLLNNLEFTGGPNGLVGIPVPELFGHSFGDPLVIFGHSLPSQANFYYLSALLVVISIVFAERLHDSRVGLAWNALRTDELAARCQGINVTWYKVLAFAVDAFLAGFAGTIYAFYVGFISPDNFTFLVSVTIMTMVIAGGMDNILGVIVGAFLLTLLPEKLRAFSDYRILFFGVTVIMFLMIRPQGLFPQRLRRYGD